MAMISFEYISKAKSIADHSLCSALAIAGSEEVVPLDGKEISLFDCVGLCLVSSFIVGLQGIPDSSTFDLRRPDALV
eukprot:1421090-Ditylum_brightwellii.AAC.1